ncbi:potassium transporter TrkG [soil metagenome]
MNGRLAAVALVGRVVVLFSLVMCVPLGFAIWHNDAGQTPFVESIAFSLILGLATVLMTRHVTNELQLHDGFVLVVLTWIVLPGIGSLPLWLAIPGLSFTDAYFEAMSGFTTTGATVLIHLDLLPVSINVWRCFMSFIGGLGIIVLAVAILPLLGVGGAQMFKAESAGPMKDAKLTPRISETARGLWSVYFGAAVLCVLAFHAAGMSWDDAFMHMCTTLSAGGFSPYDASFGHWNSPLIEAVAIFFMMVAGASWALYFVALRQHSPKVLWKNVELRAYVGTVAVTVAVVAVYLDVQGVYPDFLTSLRQAAFHVVSIATTTGFANTDYARWPAFVPWLMLLVGCFATCAGSTGGGIKMVRMLLLLKQSRRELVRIVHPNVVNPVVLAGALVPPRVMQSVIAFMMMYGATLVGLTMLLLFSGLDVETAFTALVACLNNIGPGLGGVGPAGSFRVLSDFQTWVCTAAMLLGRLELLSVLVLFTPQFWRR